MAVAVRSELDEIKESIKSLSMAGKYGQAVQLLKKALESNALFLFSDDEDDWASCLKGFLCTKGCLDFSESSGGGCCGLYCLGMAACLFCCGEDAASACFCDWIGDGCTSCLRSGGC